MIYDIVPKFWRLRGSRATVLSVISSQIMSDIKKKVIVYNWNNKLKKNCHFMLLTVIVMIKDEWQVICHIKIH